MIFARKTVAEKTKFEGLGLHTAAPVKVTVHPSNEGIAFRSGGSRWKAIPENVTDTTRCTGLGEISTIEHLMSALAGLEITDAEVEVEGVELPAMGGCSLGYVEELKQVGFTSLEPAPHNPIFKRVFFQEHAIKVAVGGGTGHWKFSFDMGDRWPEVQVFETTDVVKDYAAQIAPARTFALEDELPMIAEHGLGKGLDEDSAIILVHPDTYRFPTRFPDEPARHKMLDLMGDIYLAGIPLRLLNVVAERSGHRANVETARRLKEMVDATAD